MSQIVAGCPVAEGLACGYRFSKAVGTGEWMAYIKEKSLKESLISITLCIYVPSGSGTSGFSLHCLGCHRKGRHMPCLQGASDLVGG